MKRVWAALLLLAASGQLYADEGMWVLKELNKQNLARMAELGFTPSYDQDVPVLRSLTRDRSSRITIVVSEPSSS